MGQFAVIECRTGFRSAMLVWLMARSGPED